MTHEEANQLVADVSRVRHRGNGRTGIYEECYISGGLQLIVDDGTGRRTWAADDCELAR